MAIAAAVLPSGWLLQSVTALWRSAASTICWARTRFDSSENWIRRHPRERVVCCHRLAWQDSEVSKTHCMARDHRMLSEPNIESEIRISVKSRLLPTSATTVPRSAVVSCVLNRLTVMRLRTRRLRSFFSGNADRWGRRAGWRQLVTHMSLSLIRRVPANSTCLNSEATAPRILCQPG